MALYQSFSFSSATVCKGGRAQFYNCPSFHSPFSSLLPTTGVPKFGPLILVLLCVHCVVIKCANFKLVPLCYSYFQSNAHTETFFRRNFRLPDDCDHAYLDRLVFFISLNVSVLTMIATVLSNRCIRDRTLKEYEITSVRACEQSEFC